MSRSIFLVSLVCTAVNGFGISKLSNHFQGSSSEFNDRQLLSSKCQNSPFLRNCALHQVNDSSDDADQEKPNVNTMAWFLTTQLLEVVLQEVAKGEDSKMSTDDMQKLTDALEVAPQEAVTTSQGDDPKDAVDQFEESKNIPAVEEEEEEEEVEVEEPSPILSTAAAEEVVSYISKDTPTLEEEEEEEEEEEVSTGTEESESEKATVTDTASETTENEIDVENEETSESDENDTDTESPPGFARIPSVISKTLGRPLEVVMDSVPPLRKLSIPKAKAVDTSTSEKTFETSDTPSEEEEVASAEEAMIEEVKDSSTEGNAVVSQETASEEEPNDESISEPMVTPDTLDSTIAVEEKTSFSQSDTQSSSNDEASLAAKYGKMTLEDRAFAILSDLGMIEGKGSGGNSNDEVSSSQVNTVLDIVNDDNKSPSNNSGTSMTSSILEEDDFESDATLDEEEIEPRTSDSSKRKRLLRPIRKVFDKVRGKSLPENTESPTIIENEAQSRNDAKTPQDESELAERYARMELEDRAFAILSDLGMI